MAHEAATEALPIFEGLSDEIVSLLTTCSSEGEALSKLEEWRRKRETSDDVALSIWRPMVRGDLGGRLFVFDVELRDRVKLKNDGVVLPFLSLPFTEAINYATNRGLVNDEGLYDLLKLYRKRGEEVARATLDTLQQKTADALRRAVAEGSTLSDFIDEIESESRSLGITERKRWYLENVFRTSVQSAYGAGRFKAMTTDAVMMARPYVEYRTVGDSRVRESHDELDGKQWEITDSSWHRFAPPNSYNCRCSTVTLAADEVDEGQLNRVLSPTARPHPSFDSTPKELVELPIAAE